MFFCLTLVLHHRITKHNIKHDMCVKAFVSQLWDRFDILLHKVTKICGVFTRSIMWFGVLPVYSRFEPVMTTSKQVSQITFSVTAFIRVPFIRLPVLSDRFIVKLQFNTKETFLAEEGIGKNQSTLSTLKTQRFMANFIYFHWTYIPS